MKKLSLSLLLLVGAITAFADEDRYEAYVIGLKKDTTRGFIVTDKLETIHLGIVFEDNTGALHTYSPGAIAGFSINILDYWHRYVLIDVGEPAGKAPGSSPLIFAEVLNDEGEVKFFKYRRYVEKDPNVNALVAMSGGRLYGTEYCFVRGKEDMLRLQQSSLFTSSKKKLRAFFKGCPAVTASINRSKDLWEDMPGIVRQYNRCRAKPQS